MASTKLVVHPPIPHHLRATTKMIKLHSSITATHHPQSSSSSITKNGSFLDFPCGPSPIHTTTRASGLEVQEPTSDSLEQIKKQLYSSVQGINRGIFGVPSVKKADIEGLVKVLESLNPTSNPTTKLDKVNGWWKLVYSTITILGSKRTKLGLRDFITLGDFMQRIDVAKGKAVNVIKFNARGFSMLNGELKIEASFEVSSKSRVDIRCDSSTIIPDQLMNVFQKNYDLLLSIFNSEGWLEITYVDKDLRIGRDDKGNIFVLERFEQ